LGLIVVVAAIVLVDIAV